MKDGHPCIRTAHSVNPVPIAIYDPSYEKYKDYKPEIKSGLSITSIAATILKFLGIEVPKDYDEPLIEWLIFLLILNKDKVIC